MPTLLLLIAPVEVLFFGVVADPEETHAVWYGMGSATPEPEGSPHPFPLKLRGLAGLAWRCSLEPVIACRLAIAGTRRAPGLARTGNFGR